MKTFRIRYITGWSYRDMGDGKIHANCREVDIEAKDKIAALRKLGAGGNAIVWCRPRD
jgi:hypothetical protein